MIEYKHIRQLASVYAISAVLFFTWMAWNGLLFSMYQPIFFNNQTDLTGNYILITGLHLRLIEHHWLKVLMDVLFVLMPVAMCVGVIRKSKCTRWLAIGCATIGWLYAWMYSILSVISIEVFTAFIFTPLMFTALTLEGFYFRMHILRLIYLIIFFSTAWWKFRAGGFFQVEQMQTILFRQHTAALAYGSSDVFTAVYKFLIAHPMLSYSLYVTATLLEATMVIGFFTRKYDRLLLALSLLFIGMDYLLMEINYFSWIPMVAVLFFSKKQLPPGYVSSPTVNQ